MSPTKFFLFSTISLFFLACGNETKVSKLFTLEIKGKEFQKNQLVDIQVHPKGDQIPERVTYSIDGKILPRENNRVRLEVDHLGKKELIAVVEYGEQSTSLKKNIRVLSDQPPTLYTYEIINEFPHDIGAFTQGLEFYGGFLYESTGQLGKSSLRRTNFETGEVLAKVDLDYNFFGEGLTVLNGKIYQLTWRSKTGFVYDAGSLERITSFQYGQSKEGWGLCNDQNRIYKSDGTERIWILNPETLMEEGFIQIVTNKSLFNRANELEYVDGKIYANVWQKESMMIIDATSGAIEGVVNLGGLQKKVRQHDDLDVLNGIAYHPERKTFFVTGKNWDKLFEIRLLEK